MELIVYCPSCGNENTEADQFCSNCGTPINAGAPEMLKQQNMINSPVGQQDTRSRFNKRYFIIGLVLLAVGISGYFAYKQFVHHDSPGAVAEAFLIAMANKDCSTYIDLTSARRVGGDRDNGIKNCNRDLSDERNINIISFEVTEETIDGDRATVKFREVGEVDGKREDGSGTVNLVKEDGNWKIESYGG
jgi:hypothetical protein